MAVESLFNASYTELLERVRVETVTDEQTVSVIQMTVTGVRTGFYKKLGESRVSELLGYSLVDNPSTLNEIARADAAGCEVLWVTYLLMERLPTLFMSSSSSSREIYNDTPLFRDSSADKDARKVIDSLKAQVDALLAGLDTSDTVKSTTLAARSIGATTPYIIDNEHVSYV